MREEFVDVVAENQRLHKELDERDGELAAGNNEITTLKTTLEKERAEHTAEIGERDERIKRLEADNATLAGDNKRLAASDACHNSPHSPPRTGTWTAEYHRKKAIEALHAR